MRITAPWCFPKGASRFGGRYLKRFSPLLEGGENRVSLWTACPYKRSQHIAGGTARVGQLPG